MCDTPHKRLERCLTFLAVMYKEYMKTIFRKFQPCLCDGVYTLNIRHPYGWAEGWIITDKVNIKEASDFEQAPFEAVSHALDICEYFGCVVYLHNLFVKEKHRGKGIGKLILDEFIHQSTSVEMDTVDDLYPEVDLVCLFAKSPNDADDEKLYKFYDGYGLMKKHVEDSVIPYYYKLTRHGEEMVECFGEEVA